MAELAATLGCSDERILEALQARRGRDTLSLSAPPGASDDRGAALQDVLGSSERGYARAEARVELESLLRLVPPRTRLILRLRFERDLTQAEIGALLGVSQMQVSRIVRAAIEQLNGIAMPSRTCAPTAARSRPDRAAFLARAAVMRPRWSLCSRRRGRSPRARSGGRARAALGR